MTKHFDKPEIIHKLIEIIGNKFSYEEILVIGRRFEINFEICTAENQYGRLRLPPHPASEYLMNFIRKNDKISELVQFLIDLDCHSLNGRQIIFKELEELLVTLRHNGIGYDLNKREFYLISEKEAGPKWENCLHEEKEYEFSYVSVDIVKSSDIARSEDIKLVKNTINSLFELIKKSAHNYNGSIWSWQGDGGIVVFWGKQCIFQSIYFSMEALGLLPLFNVRQNSLENDIALRFGIDCGKTSYKKEKGNIISNNLNFAVHLEKKCTAVNSITISDRVHKTLDFKQSTYFQSKGQLEKTIYYSYSPCYFYSSRSDDILALNSQEKNDLKDRKKRHLLTTTM
jgi:class 3 adenylate cyclase